MGATAPLIFTGGSGVFRPPASSPPPAMALPMHLYLLVAQGATSMDAAYGTAFVMMALIYSAAFWQQFTQGGARKKWNIS